MPQDPCRNTGTGHNPKRPNKRENADASSDEGIPQDRTHYDPPPLHKKNITKVKTKQKTIQNEHYFKGGKYAAIRTYCNTVCGQRAIRDFWGPSWIQITMQGGNILSSQAHLEHAVRNGRVEHGDADGKAVKLALQLRKDGGDCRRRTRRGRR